MLNTYKIGGNTTKVSLNTPSTGIIQKSHPKSRIIRFHAKSPMAKMVLSSDAEPYIERRDINAHYERYNKILITVLQVMIFGDNELLVEIVDNDNLVDE